MNCLIALFGLILPRAIGVYWWLTDTSRWSQVFGSGNVLIPALGILFVPWTTLMYLFFWKPEGIDLIGWIVIGFMRPRPPSPAFAERGYLFVPSLP